VLGGQCPFAGAATPPLLEFDVPFTISCRSLPLKDPARVDPDKELIEVVIPISARVRAGSEKDLKQCLYTLVGPADSESISVADWLPRTELKTEFAKPIQVSKENLAKIGINLSAHYVVAATSDASGQLKSGVTYEMLPPQEIVLASGTVQHGHGVFFKLKPSTQTTLEGIKSFSAILSVPRGWRGGCLKLECNAVGLERGAIAKLDREVSSGLAVFCLALHLEGDTEAERLAEHVALCQQELFDAFVQHRREVDAASHKTFFGPGGLGRWPWFFDKPDSAGDLLPAPGEVALLQDVLDRATAPARPMPDYPAPVMEKLWTLQRAAEALQHLPTGRSSSSNNLMPRSDSARSPGKAPEKATSVATTGLQRTPAGKGEEVASARQVVPAGVAAGAGSLGSGADGGLAATGHETAHEDTSAAGQLAQAGKGGSHLVVSVTQPGVPQ